MCHARFRCRTGCSRFTIARSPLSHGPRCRTGPAVARISWGSSCRAHIICRTGSAVARISWRLGCRTVPMTPLSLNVWAALGQLCRTGRPRFTLSDGSTWSCRIGRQKYSCRTGRPSCCTGPAVASRTGRPSCRTGPAAALAVARALVRALQGHAYHGGPAGARISPGSVGCTHH